MPPVTYLLSSIAAVALTSLLTWYAWKHRSVSGAVAFTWLMAGLTEWSIASTFSLGVAGLPAKLLWAKVEYLGASGIALAWLIFSIQYTNQEKWLTRLRLFLLSVIPLLTLLLVFTNDLHGLVWDRVWLDGNIRVSHGAWYWIFIAYSYFLFVLGLGLLSQMFFHAPNPYRWQAGAVIAGGLATWAWTIFYISASAASTHPEFSPFVISLAGLAFAWSLFRFRLLDIVPVAREMVIESMSDGMLVLDVQDRIIDVNPAAEAILDCASGCIGRRVEEIIPAWQEWTRAWAGNPATRAEAAFGHGGLNRSYEVRCSPLFDRREQVTGQLVIFTDITERKFIEAAEREQRTLAEALRDTAAALNTTLRLDEVLDRILMNIGRVVPVDAVNIMLVETGVARIARSQGYTGDHIQQALTDLRLEVACVPTFRRMAETGQPLIIPDVQSQPGWVAVPGTDWIRSYAAAPIRSRGETIGFLNLDSAIPDFFTLAHAERLQAFVDQAAIAIENARLYAEVQKKALTDSLTGLSNYRALLEQGQHEVERAIRLGHPLSALMIDIDHFKEVNDSCGHPAGDRLLRVLVKKFQENVRTIDLIGRYGGDEFVILLIENDLETAYQVAERLRLAALCARVMADQGPVGCTISIGAAALDDRIQDITQLIERADEALYVAKQQGRNRVGALAG